MTTSLALPWLLPAAVVAHLIEEFVWPGGFGPWYRRTYPDRAASLTRGFLVRINALYLALAVFGAAWASGTAPRGVALWLTLAGIGAANGVFHLLAVIRTREYSPGVVTGMLLYVPLTVWGTTSFIRSGRASVGTATIAILAGPLYHVYSAWKHRRGSRDQQQQLPQL